ncbi:hypothetical protein OKCENTRAL2016_5 [Mycobacterium phage OKCentral2016]|uniref:Glycine-rich domain-containing protein n=1 Tax=Mycobacterium phage OKCentral2016 TaxID=2040289 RepID=A0A291AUX2_9CAUD|nr:hypothetical protein OKCENTRAL2016_5 [Mycobacterium phage OKCentral2016]
MAIYLGNTKLTNFRVGTQTPDRIFLGNELVWPDFTPVPQQYSSAGAWQFVIPANCRFIDVILLGGGGGGQASAAWLNVGQPGAPGSWNGVTLKRGVDIPWDLAVISGVVGGGGGGGQASAAWLNVGQPGAPGSWNGVTLKRGVDIPWDLAVISGVVGGGGSGGIGPSVMPGLPGADSTLLVSGQTVAVGQAGGGGLGWADRAGARGRSPGNYTYNGRLYVGGAAATGDNQPGKPPGGSGSGHYPGFGSGQSGAAGAVWVYAY